jgi:hypothetical protein
VTFVDWAETEMGKPLELPINGKIYRIPHIGARSAKRLEEIVAAEPGSEKSAGPDEIYTLALGPVYDEMLADDVPKSAMLDAAKVAWNRCQGGDDPVRLAALWMAVYAPVADDTSARDVAPQTPDPAPAKPPAKKGARGPAAKPQSRRPSS